MLRCQLGKSLPVTTYCLKFRSLFIGKYKHLMEEQKETLKKERQEHMSLVEKLQENEQELKKKTREMSTQ